MKNNLQQQITQFGAKIVHVAALNGISDLVGLLHCIRSDRGEILLDVPGTAIFRVPEVAHNFK